MQNFTQMSYVIHYLIEASGCEQQHSDCRWIILRLSESLLCCHIQMNRKFLSVFYTLHYFVDKIRSERIQLYTSVNSYGYSIYRFLDHFMRLYLCEPKHSDICESISIYFIKSCYMEVILARWG